MDIQQLKYFCEVARTEHVTKAASRLHIAQPALTRSVRKLEGELETCLFRRSGRGISITPEGKYLQERVEPILNSLAGIPADVKRFSEERSRTVTLSLHAAEDMMIGNVIDYKRFFPDSVFRLDGDFTGEADVLCTSRLIGEGGEPNITTGEFSQDFTEEIVLVVPKDSPLGDRVSPSDLDSLDLVLLSRNRPFREHCDQLLAQTGITANVVFESDSFALASRIVQAGMGCALWPIYSWKEISHDNSRVVRIDSPSFAQVIQTELRDPEGASLESRRFFSFICGVADKFHRLKGKGLPELDLIPELAVAAGSQWSARELASLVEEQVQGPSD